MAATSAYLANENGLSKIDHIVLSTETSSVRQGESIFVIQGALDNPAYLMAHMKTGDVIARPVEQSLSQLQALGQMYRQQQEQQQKLSITPPHRMV